MLFYLPMSHPTWVRGLKHERLAGDIIKMLVAPYMGAWIETIDWLWFGINLTVAPYMGAWIETCLAPASAAT